MFGSIGLPELFVVGILLVAMLAVVAWPAGLICRRIGFPAMLGLLAVIPFANLVLLWVVALSPWPSSDVKRGA
jgi:hypothetical protein